LRGGSSPWGLGCCSPLGLLSPSRPPTPGPHATTPLQADLLTDYLARSEAHLSAQSRDPLYRPALHAGQLQPARPLRDESLRVSQMRCYGYTPSAALGGQGSAEQVAPLQLLQSQGWEFREYDDRSDAGEKKYKPGWIATQPGAVLRVAVATDFPGAGNATVQLSYLSSYEHMGRARASCVEGCRCEAGEIEALNTAERHSVPRVHVLLATRARRCVVQLEVLPESGSGQHKFKLMQVVVSTSLDVTQRLGALQRAQVLAAKAH
jgi:hypothetical protein